MYVCINVCDNNVNQCPRCLEGAVAQPADDVTAVSAGTRTHPSTHRSIVYSFTISLSHSLPHVPTYSNLGSIRSVTSQLSQDVCTAIRILLVLNLASKTAKLPSKTQIVVRKSWSNCTCSMVMHRNVSLTSLDVPE